MSSEVAALSRVHDRVLATDNDKLPQILEKLLPGETVVSFDEKTGKLESETLLVNKKGQRDYYFVVYTLRRKVKATANHPFFVGGFHTSGSKFGGKEKMIFSGTNVKLVKISI